MIHLCMFQPSIKSYPPNAPHKCLMRVLMFYAKCLKHRYLMSILMFLCTGFENGVKWCVFYILCTRMCTYLWWIFWCYTHKIEHRCLMSILMHLMYRFSISESSTQRADLRQGSSLPPHCSDSRFWESAWWSRSPPKIQSIVLCLIAVSWKYHHNPLIICWVMAGFPIAQPAWWSGSPAKFNSLFPCITAELILKIS